MYMSQQTRAAPSYYAAQTVFAADFEKLLAFFALVLYNDKLRSDVNGGKETAFIYDECAHDNIFADSC